ncbi:hypothetical protein LguiA_015304 [Lonicera macranthoides]
MTPLPLSLAYFQASSSSSATLSTTVWPCLPPPPPAVVPARSSGANKTSWGNDEVHLSLSLLSIRYYDKMKLLKRQIKAITLPSTTAVHIETSSESSSTTSESSEGNALATLPPL